MRRLWSVALLLVVVTFTAQNAEVTEIRFLGWSFVLSRAVVIFLALVIGILIGWLTPWTPSEERRGNGKQPAQSEPRAH